MYDYCPIYAKVIVERLQGVLAGVRGRVGTIRVVWKLIPGAEDMAMRVACTFGKG
jgi:hypothetical protein